MSFRKIIVLIFIISFCAGWILACTNKSVIDLNDETVDIAFNGDKVLVYQDYQDYLNPKPGQSTVGDTTLKHLKHTETELNIKFEVSTFGNIASRLLAAAVSGTSSADIILDYATTAFDMAEAGLLISFDNIEVEDKTNIKWGTPSLLAETNFYGKQYGIFPYLWLGLPNVGGMFLVNMDIIEKNGFTDPHEYIEQGVWNWENMQKTFAQASFSDENGQHIGMIFDSGRDPVLLPFVAIRSNGQEPISKSNGFYVSNLESTLALEAYDYLDEMLSDGIIDGAGATDDLFRDTQLYTYLFCSSPAFISDKVRTGYVPFAYGPNGNKDTVSSMLIPSDSLCAHVYFLFSALTKFNGEELGVISDVLFSVCDPINYPNGWKDYYETNLFHYKSDYENYVKAVEGVTVINLSQIETSYKIAYSGFSEFENGQSISSVIPGISDAIQTEMNDKIK